MLEPLPRLNPPHPPPPAFARHLPLSAPFGWLDAGWRDFWNRPFTSLAPGIVMLALSLGVLWAL